MWTPSVVSSLVVRLLLGLALPLLGLLALPLLVHSDVRRAPIPSLPSLPVLGASCRRAPMRGHRHGAREARVVIQGRCGSTSP